MTAQYFVRRVLTRHEEFPQFDVRRRYKGKTSVVATFRCKRDAEAKKAQCEGDWLTYDCASAEKGNLQ